MSNIQISTDKEKLDLPFIQGFLSQTYWGKGRSMDEVITAMEHSINFGVYKKGQQIGYARVVTDYIQFAYLMDVFIIEDQRGQGYSKQLMQFVLEFESFENVKMWRLATSDAHGLYQQFGFSSLEKPENMMERAIAKNISLDNNG
jgi:predicted GNAT family N-acyltransferase